MKKFCKNCKFFFGTEYFADMQFKEIQEISRVHAVPNIAAGRLESNCKIKMCQHLICFDTKSGFNLELGFYQKAIRIRGQAQLNKNCDCTYYRRKWYKFWVEDSNNAFLDSLNVSKNGLNAAPTDPRPSRPPAEGRPRIDIKLSDIKLPKELDVSRLLLKARLTAYDTMLTNDIEKWIKALGPGRRPDFYGMVSVCRFDNWRNLQRKIRRIKKS